MLALAPPLAGPYVVPYVALLSVPFLLRVASAFFCRSWSFFL